MKKMIFALLITMGQIAFSEESQLACSLNTSVDNAFNHVVKNVTSKEWTDVEGSLGQKRLNLFDMMLDGRIDILASVHQISVNDNQLSVAITDKSTGSKVETYVFTNQISLSMTIPALDQQPNKVDVVCVLKK